MARPLSRMVWRRPPAFPSVSASRLHQRSWLLGYFCDRRFLVNAAPDHWQLPPMLPSETKLMRHFTGSGTAPRGDRLLAMLLADAREKMRQKGPQSLIFRIGISGSPGVGKSSFIEALGMRLCEQHKKRLAVLTVDPSSMSGVHPPGHVGHKYVGGIYDLVNTHFGRAISAVDISAGGHFGRGRLGRGQLGREPSWPRGHLGRKGSILGDLARMQNLSCHPNAYIRQSPTSGALGGVTRGTHDAIVLCEGAGYDVVLVETVGVGQSETTVADMVDMYVLLVSPAQGDEVQGVKRGVMELADLVVVTKADGSMESATKMTASEYMSALKYMQPRHKFWKPSVQRASSVTGLGLDDVWQTMQDYWATLGQTGELKLMRDRQMTSWIWQHVQDEVMTVFAKHPDIIEMFPKLEDAARRGEITPGMASERLLKCFMRVLKAGDE